MLTTLLTVAVVIVGVLAAVAMYLRKKVALMEKAKAEQDHLLKQQQQEQREKWNKSIQILAQSILTEQVTPTEAAMRIGVLLEYLGVNSDIKEEYSVFFQLAEATAYIPILNEWKKLSKQEQRRYDAERLVIEKQYKDFIEDAAHRINGQYF